MWSVLAETVLHGSLSCPCHSVGRHISLWFSSQTSSMQDRGSSAASDSIICSVTLMLTRKQLLPVPMTLSVIKLCRTVGQIWRISFPPLVHSMEWHPGDGVEGSISRGEAGQEEHRTSLGAGLRVWNGAVAYCLRENQDSGNLCCLCSSQVSTVFFVFLRFWFSILLFFYHLPVQPQLLLSDTLVKVFLYFWFPRFSLLSDWIFHHQFLLPGWLSWEESWLSEERR